MEKLECINFIISAKHPEDVFLRASDVDSQYKKFASLVHPDVNSSSKEANEAFRKLGLLYKQVQEKIENGTYGNKVIATISSKKGTYELNSIVATGDLCDVYSAKDTKGNNLVVKLLRNPKNSDLVKNEATNLSFLRNTSPSKDLQVMAHIPNLVDSFEIKLDSKKVQANVLTAYSNFYTLADVRKKYPNGVDIRTAAWMWNRMLGSFVASHQSEIIHGAVTPDHFMICPENHNGILVDWSYSVKDNKSIKAMSSKWKHIYPEEVLIKSKPNFSTDIYMSAMSIIFVLGGNPERREIPTEVPRPIQGLLRACLLGKMKRPQDAYELHAEFQDILKQLYGEPKFHSFIM